MAFDASHCPILVDRRVSPGNARPSSNNVFSFPPLFSLSNLEKYATLAKKKKQKKVCDLFNSSYLVFILLVVSSFIYICFQFNPLSFDFSIEFILLFYDVLGLILNILITNLDSWIFYQILIFFQFHP
jgi:hypothetical protein